MRRKIFIISFIIIICAILGLFFIYRMVFNGDFSTDSADWGNLGDFLGGIGMLLLTCLNVWIFYELTQEINKKEMKLKTQQLVYEKLDSIIDSIIHTSNMSRENILNPLKELYFYINWVNYRHLYSDKIEEERVTICKSSRPILGIDDNENLLKEEDIKTDKQSIIGIRSQLLDFISHIHQSILEEYSKKS